MAATADTFKYELEVDGAVVFRGVTSDLQRRESEHRERWPEGTVVKIGRRTTRAAALAWLRRQEARGDRIATD